ncbi:urea amidolyase associated protein UAAP1 [Rouxiella badensis]|jgi:urea carboxylase-associated protein 2|uniref:Urea carboxylase n=1 Tax=Rouxiella badensis TaxID=1646377 RepID=A0A1X0WA27_9GAMM|nr:urea amidolyase associated protein UAAP1 [Rouxiella badensis]MCC3702906.1 urea carboxylase-associated family protein [Rouxiella badensis]MCC3720234.1 urea carboxylase-associated family protein [Rouxiella badensis]MCC3729897.1 urea carboxylase-associated family protein [Rouxiella badensis]MCC3733920.1 urea carboxylase-associated family protein [Rouxiella badensis]MCC3741384.1 urea carboxylase-associated family protein [Rouxiella badensis]
MSESHEILYQTQLQAGSHWSMRVKSGSALRLTDVEGGANLGMLFYNPENLLERYNAPDTLKCQHTFRLTEGHCLYSDMGRIFCGIEHDSFGWHDTVCGTLNAAQTEQRFGALSYQQAHNARHQNGYDSFLVELAKYGLGKRDMAACVNLFSKVTVDENGYLALDTRPQPTASVTLRFAMDTLVVMHTCPHPMTEAARYPRAPIDIALLAGSAPLPAHCLQSAENQRGQANNDLYHHTTCCQGAH